MRRIILAALLALVATSALAQSASAADSGIRKTGPGRLEIAQPAPDAGAGRYVMSDLVISS